MTVAATRSSLLLPACLAALVVVVGCKAESTTDQAAQTTGVTAPVVEAPSFDVLFERLTRAEREVAYTGHKRAIHGERGASRETLMRIAHYSDGDTVLRWGEGEGTASWCLNERPSWLRDRDQLLSNYHVELDPERGPRIADRPTQRLLIEGRRPGRPTLELHVDAATWVVLRERHVSPDGEVLLISEFEAIVYGDPTEPLPGSDAEHLLARSGLGSIQTPEEQAAVRPEGWNPLQLDQAPPGFRRVARKMLSCGSLGEYWSDGLAAFSVQQRPTRAGDEDEAPDDLSCGKLRGHNWVSGTVRGVSVRVVGNLTVAELEAVVQSLRSTP